MTADRQAAIVLVLPDGVVIGQLPPVPVATPWWQDVTPVVDAVRERYGIDVTILRLLESEFDAPPGGKVTYLAETTGRVLAELWDGVLDEHPLRLAHAKPGGPAADLDWAFHVLAERGLEPTGTPVQTRTWNLSSLWRIPLEGTAAWLKVVPPFMAHEGALLRRLAGPHTPRLLGSEGTRCLIAEVPGGDLYDAPFPILKNMVTVLVGLQQQWKGEIDALLELGLPDYRPVALSAAIDEVFERTADLLSAADRILLAGFIADLPQRFARLTECGLGDGLIHGDFHPGNFRGEGTALVLLDWGDAGIGHPLLDQSAFLPRVPPDAVAPIRAHWNAEWSRQIPGSDPSGAAVLLAPIAAARQAVIYRQFLDSIEPSEHPYHRGDPELWLRRAAALLREEAAHAR